MAMSDGGKGSNPRPFSVPFEEYGTSHVRIFGEKKSKYCSVCGKTFSWCQCGDPDDKITRYNEETQEAMKLNSK